MSLATDIVARAAKLPASKPRKEVVFTPRKWRDLPVGVHYDPRCVTRPYHCRAYADRKALHLGYYATAERAGIAHRLAKHWIGLGFALGEIPVVTSELDPDSGL